MRGTLPAEGSRALSVLWAPVGDGRLSGKWCRWQCFPSALRPHCSPPLAGAPRVLAGAPSPFPQKAEGEPLNSGATGSFSLKPQLV